MSGYPSTVTRVHELLHQVGLERHAALFAENDIDDEVLGELDDADLKELGISLGHRKKILKAIAALSEAASAPVAPRPPVDAEHRQLTVMFCDLVASTSLSHRLEVETYREVITEYQSAATGAIEQFDGYVARYMGDGLLSYFGYPQAHEEDAERAVRASLAVVDAVSRLKPRMGTTLAVRVGIATGAVVAGDVIGEGAAEEHAVLGETPNLAARLQQRAEPDCVLISSETKALTGRLFDCADAGAHKLKGFDRRVRGWRVLGESGADSRFEATRSSDAVPLVGRDSEVLMLLDRWSRAVDEEGQVVLLSGEPGIGKSRLVHALRERVADDSPDVYQFQCVPYYASSAFYPFIEHIQRTAGFAAGDEVAAKRTKLQTWLGANGSTDLDRFSSLCALLSLSTGDETRLEISPSAQKEHFSQILIDRLTDSSTNNPILMLFEDVHWADPTTLDILERLIDTVAAKPILLVVTHRPAFTPPWQGQGQITAHSLTRLGKRQATQLMEGVTGGRSLPEILCTEIIGKADGVPLFVEELTKTIIESGFLKKTASRYTLNGPLPALSIPNTLRDSLVARLDRLSLGKEVAQIASVIGRQFSHELLAAVSGLEDDDLDDALAQLEKSELIFKHGSETEAGFIFKHALVQDAAYDSLLKSRRRQLHADIAALLEELFPETVAVEPELMAHHLNAAGLYPDAVEYWQYAAQSALERSAYPESLSHLDAALQTVENMPEKDSMQPAELDIQIARGGVLMVSEGYLDRETRTAFNRARELSQLLGDHRKKFAALRGLHGIHIVRAELDTALDVASECLAIGKSEEQSPMVALAHRLVGQTFCLRGELSEAREHLERSQTLDTVDSQGAIAALLHGGGHRLITPAFLSHVLWLQGFPDQALSLAEAGLSGAADKYGAFAQTAGRFFLSWVYGWRREFDRLHTVTTEMKIIADEHDISAWVSTAELLPDWPELAADSTPRRASLARKKLKEVRAAVGLRTPYKLGLLALALANDDPAGALTIVEDALHRNSVTGESWAEAELLRIKGEILLSEPHPASQAASQCFREACSVAEQQGANAWMLRATTSLARLLAQQGENTQALDILSTAYGRFSEGFDTADLRDAQTLIDSLS